MVGKNLIWDLSGKFFNQLTGFLISIILTRLLSPEDFGLIGMMMVFITIAQVYVEMGFGASLIQKKEVSENLYSSVFWLNLLMGVIISSSIFLSADLIASFYDKPELKNIARALSLMFIISSIGRLQQIRLMKKMAFRNISVVEMSSTLFSGLIAILFAFMDYGVWVLVIQHLIKNSINTIGLFIFEKWKPKLMFSISDIKSIWKFSSRIFSTAILRSIFEQLDSLFIAKLFNASTLGYYTRGKTLSSMFTTTAGSSLNRVFFPYISKLQDEKEELKRIYLKSINIIAFASLALSSILLLSAHEIILLLFTEKWEKTAYFFSFMVVSDGISKATGPIMLNMLLGLGHAGTEFKMLLIKRSVWFIALFALFYFGISAYLYCIVVHSVFIYLVDSYAVSTIFPVKFKEQYTIHLKYILVAVISFLIVFFVLPSIPYKLVGIIIKSAVFLCIYSVINYKLDSTPLLFFWSKISNIIKK